MDLKFKYLHKVDGGANNNKMYIMRENDNNTFTVTYGREGAAKPAVKVYPMNDWETILREKLSKKKGYTDVTEYRSVVTATASTTNSQGKSIISTDSNVKDLIEALQNYASAQTAEVYRSESAGVTQKQVDDAQMHLDNLSFSFKNHYNTSSWDLNLFNAELTRLYIVIPRKMRNVADHLVTDTDWDKAKIETLIGEEQSNLDSMASQVGQNTAQAASNDTVADAPTAAPQSLLEILGLEVSVVTDTLELALIKNKAQNHARRILRAFKVVNKSTQVEFDKKINASSNKKTDLLWHGSRAQNWYFIIQQGLKIRPSGAIHTGSMFGDGIYGACESDKSMGYTDNGRWVNGRANNKVYMALFDFHLGKQYAIKSSDSSLSGGKLKSLGNFDSTWGQTGPNLRRDEFIIYTHEQCTIKYLVEFSS